MLSCGATNHSRSAPYGVEWSRSVPARTRSPYFNELAGGLLGGAKHLADSNLDWGQGLPALKDWMDREGVDRVYSRTSAQIDPSARHPLPAIPGYGRVGLPGGETIPAEASRHVVAISANHLLGMFLNEPAMYSWLRGRAPTAVVGGCIYLFDLTGDAEAIARVRLLHAR